MHREPQRDPPPPPSNNLEEAPCGDGDILSELMFDLTSHRNVGIFYFERSLACLYLRGCMLLWGELICTVLGDFRWGYFGDTICKAVEIAGVLW